MCSFYNDGLLKTALFIIHVLDDCFKFSQRTFKCDGSTCLNIDNVCDNMAQCVDQSDEDTTFCSKCFLICTCHYNCIRNMIFPDGCSKIAERPFHCDRTRCLSHTKVCDGFQHCLDGKDESYETCSTYPI